MAGGGIAWHLVRDWGRDEPAPADIPPSPTRAVQLLQFPNRATNQTLAQRRSIVSTVEFLGVDTIMLALHRACVDAHTSFTLRTMSPPPSP